MKQIFISYSHKDKLIREQVENHLSFYKKHFGSINAWSDKELKCGDEVNPEIFKAINDANAAILLISNDFLISDFIFIEELPRLFQKRKEEGIPIFSFIIKSCNWNEITSISKLLVRPYDGKSLSQFRGDKKEKILADFAKEVNNILTDETKATFDVETKSVTQQTQSSDNHIIIELSNLFKKFEGLNFIPPNSLSNLSPFHNDEDLVFHYENFHLYSLNNKLYDFFKGIEVNGNEINISVELEQELKKQAIANYRDTISYIIERLNKNLVFNIVIYKDIETARKNPSSSYYRYDLRHPFSHLDDEIENCKIQRELHTKNCNCIQCLTHDFKFFDSYNYIESEFGHNENYNLELGYIAYKLASNNYKDAYLIYKHLRESNFKKNPIVFFIASLNLKYLYNYLRYNYSNKDLPNILKYIRDIDLDQTIFELKDNVDADVHRIIIEIKEEKLLSKIRYKVDEVYENVLNIRDIYKNGGSSSGANYALELHVQLGQLFAYYEWNYIIGNDFGNVKNIIEKILEGLLILHSIQNYSGRFEKFNSFHLLNALLFVSPKRIRKLIQRNNISELNVSKEALQEIINVFKNYLQNTYTKTVFNSLIVREEYFHNLKSFDIKNQMVEYFGSFLSLLCYIKLSKTYLTDTLIESLINFLRYNSSNLLYGTHDELSRFITIHHKLFTTEQLEQIIELWISKEYLKNSGLPKTIANLKKQKTTVLLNRELVELIYLKIANKKSDYHQLVHIFRLADNTMQKKISNFFKQCVEEDDIDSMLFCDLYLYKIIPPKNKKFLLKYTKKSLGKVVNETGIDVFGHPYSNYSFLNYMSMIYMHNIDRRYILSSLQDDIKFSPYCEWLMKFDFQEYNYANFNPEWLLLNSNYSTYMDRFKSETRIGEALEQYLSKTYNDDLGKIYLKYFFNQK